MTTATQDASTLDRHAADALRRAGAAGARGLDGRPPQFDDEERAFVAPVFEGIDAFAGREPEWEI